MLKVRRALISVSDKSGLGDFVKALDKFGVEILSTGGTAKMIRDLGVPAKDVSDYTGFPEMLDGRVKTLHPKVHAGLLAIREDKDHMDTMNKHGMGLIDMVVVNLYPFEKTVAKEGVRFEDAIENIDIGGPSMLRSAAKNHKSVCVICDPADYAKVIDDMKKNSGSISEALLSELGIKVFEKTSKYDAAIYNFFKSGARSTAHEENTFPASLNLSFTKLQDLRYGENPHQKAAFYKDTGSGEPGIAGAVQLHGKELSFNNIMDLNAAMEIVKEFRSPAAAIIKHTNPCGAATAKTLREAYIDALDCDRLSAFGSVVGFNGAVDYALADTILKECDFVECIVAPAYDLKALDALKAKKNLRIIEAKGFSGHAAKCDIDIKKVSGGLLAQEADGLSIKESDLKIVTKLKPTKDQLQSMIFGSVIVKHVKSNAIVISGGTKTVGIGAGQMSRVDSVKIASEKAGDRANGATLASDAFFPKEDGIEEAARAGVKAIIQPGGSIKDKDIIATADRLGIAMVFTGARHFKH